MTRRLFQRLLLVPFDHLNLDRGVLKGRRPGNRCRAFCSERNEWSTGRPFHKETTIFPDLFRQALRVGASKIWLHCFCLSKQRQQPLE